MGNALGVTMIEQMIQEGIKELKDLTYKVLHGQPSIEEINEFRELVVIPFNLKLYDAELVTYYMSFEEEIDRISKMIEKDGEYNLDRGFLNRLFALKERETLDEMTSVKLFDNELLEQLAKKHKEGFGEESDKKAVTLQARFDVHKYMFKYIHGE